MDNNVTLRYSDQELEEFRVLIEGKLEKSRKELDYLKDQIVELTENSNDEQGVDMFDDTSIFSELEMLNNMALRQQQFIQNLDNALVRIKNKSYGICVATGKLIDKKRLLLVPHATMSVEAKNQANEKKVFVPTSTEGSGGFDRDRELEDDGGSSSAMQDETSSKQRKIITRVIQKPTATTAAPKRKPVEDDEDDFDLQNMDWDDEPQEESSPAEEDDF